MVTIYGSRTGVKTGSALAQPYAARLVKRQSCRQCLVEILDQIFRRLEPHRDPDQAVGDAEFLAIRRRHSRMRGRGRPGDQRFHASETGRPDRDLDLFNETFSSLEPALQLDAQNPAEAVKQLP